MLVEEVFCSSLLVKVDSKTSWAMWEVATSVTKGRMAVSKNHIVAGSVVHTEMPTAYVPRADSSLSKCSPYAYSDIETSMLNAASGSTGGKFRGYAIILAARVIASSLSNITADANIKALCRNSSRCNNKSSSTHAASAQIVQRLLSCSPLTCDVALHHCIAVLEKLESNAFTVSDYDLSSISGIGLYALAATINHSCNPNCCQTFDLSTSAALSIRALRNIEKGEEITIAYIDIGKPTWWRKKELLKSYGFLCSCNRCHTSSSDGYKCQKIDCRGISRINENDLFISWKSYPCNKIQITDATDVINDSLKDHSLKISFPYGDILLENDDFNLLKCDNNGKYHLGRPGIKFKCDSCNHSICSSVIMKKVRDINSMITDIINDQEEERLNLSYRKTALGMLLQLVRQSDSGVLEFYKNYLLDDYLIENKFKVYLKVIQISFYLVYLNIIYPSGHPFPAIQQAIYAKCLLLHSGSLKTDRNIAVNILNNSINTLNISHGNNSTIVQDLVRISQGAYTHY